MFLSYSCIVGCSLAAKCSNTSIRQSLTVSVCILISNVDFLRGESQPKQSLCGLYSSKMRWNSLLTSVWLRVVQHYKNYEFVTWHAIDWPSWHFTFCTHQAKLGPLARFWQILGRRFTLSEITQIRWTQRAILQNLSTHPCVIFNIWVVILTKY